MGEELTAKVGKLQSTLQRINAPNMKALEKYVVLYHDCLLKNHIHQFNVMRKQTNPDLLIQWNL